jgi:putative endonuclease
VTDRRKVTGAQGEAAAAGYLRRNGYQILVTNWRCRLGEIDIVARDGPTLVFVEVRTRRSARLGSPEESVTATKQRRLVDLAQTYLLFLETEGRPWTGAWRIDVVAVEIDPADDRGMRLNHLPSAIEGA